MKGTLISDALGVIVVVGIAVVIIVIALILKVSFELGDDSGPISEAIEYEALFAKSYPAAASIGNAGGNSDHPFFKQFIATMYTKKEYIAEAELKSYINRLGPFGYNIKIKQYQLDKDPIQEVRKGSTNNPIDIPLVFKDKIGFLEVSINE